MASVFITGSADGLGLMAGQLLASQGHAVTLHARGEARAEAARAVLPRAADVLVGDLSTLAAMRDVAAQANARGRFDAVIHNVGLGHQQPRRVETADGLSQLWAVNVLAPYVLTALMERPARLVYLSSRMHLQGDTRLDDVQWAARPWDPAQAYSDTKLHDTLLAFGLARRWPDARVNAVDPGWVPTRMGGSDAPDDLDQAHRTQAALAAGEDPALADLTGAYLHHREPGPLLPAAEDPALQDRLFAYCAELSGVEIAPVASAR